MAFQRNRDFSMLLWSAFLPLLLFTIRTCECQECGGNFTNASGIIASPNFPKPYANNLTCIYLISRPEGEIITLTFTNISLESHYPHCHDYVQVQDGGLENSSTLTGGLFCGSLLPKKQRTTQNIMRITFASDYSLTYSGFRAIYSSTLFSYQPLLVAANGIYRLDPETQIHSTIPIWSLHKFLAIALDPLDDRVYWSTPYSIGSAFLNGSDQIKHYNFYLGSKCSGLALDYLSHLLFFADMFNGVIGLIDIPSSHVSEVLATDLDEPSDIALDIVNNVMYWTQIGTSPKIERANYDGSDRRTIVTSVERPYSITLDLDRGYLYWVDASSGVVGRSDLEGNYSTVIYSLPDYSDALCVLGLKDDMLYISQSSVYTFISRSFSFLYEVNTTTGVSVGNFSIHEFGINDFLVLDQNIVVRSPNRCDLDNGGCPYICVPKSGNARACLCPEHLYCRPDGSKLSGLDSTSTTTVFTTSSDVAPKSTAVRKVVVNGPLIFDTNGFQKLTLTCHPEDAANVIVYSWSVSCDQKGERTCSFMPLPAEDDGKAVVCVVKYTNGQSECGLFQVSLNYPPSLRPLISGYKDGDILKEGDRLNLTCSVAGGKPIVAAVIFSCPGYADDPDDTSNAKEKQSTVQISHVRASDDGLRCECTARWKNTDWYTLTAAIELSFQAPALFHDKLYSESKSPVLQWAIGGSVPIILVMIVVITIIIIKKRRDKSNNDSSTIIDDVSSITYKNLKKSELDHESSSRFSTFD